MTHSYRSLALIAIVFMWEGEWMAKLCNELIWNLISIYTLKCGNNIQTVHPCSLNGLYAMMKMQSLQIPHTMSLFGYTSECIFQEQQYTQEQVYYVPAVLWDYTFCDNPSFCFES